MFVCKYVYTLNHITTANTVLKMVSIMVDRYYVIMHPFNKRLTLSVYMIIDIPLAFSFYQEVSFYQEELSRGFWVDVKYVEKSGNSTVHILRIIIQVSGFSIPCIIVLFCFFQINYILQKSINATRDIINNSTTVKITKNSTEK